MASQTEERRGIKTPRSHMSLEVAGLNLFSLFCSAGVVLAGAGSVAVQGRGNLGSCSHKYCDSWSEIQSHCVRPDATGTQCVLVLMVVNFL